jgi:hypothetical protein
VLLKIGIVVVIVIALFVLFVATRPGAFRTARSIAIAAPPRVPFAHVNNLQAMSAWSPFEKKDPNLKRTYSGPVEGVRAMYAWSGNSEVGEGRMKIERSDTPSLVELRLEFIKPFKATNKGIFTFEPTTDGTRVTWAMEGHKNFMFKTVCLFMDSDKMVGGEFEKGLAELKEICEREVRAN